MTSTPLRVVVADDDKETREYLADLLGRLGYQVATAAGGRQLVELCRAVDPDLVLADVKMPDLDGIAAAEELNRHRPVPVILVSAYDQDDLLDRAAGAHVLAYLVKPVQEEDLRAAIRLALARFAERQALARENAELRQALEERKLLERAKGVVMKRLHVDEEEAFLRLRQLSNNRSRKLAEVVREVLDGEEVFRALEGCERAAPSTARGAVGGPGGA
jgi:two-component system, response regulator PdtaR